MESRKSGHRQRLRERFTKSGLSSFHDYEKLELLLTYCIRQSDVKPAAKRLIEKFGGLNAVFQAPVKELEKVAGIGSYSATMIKFVRELCSELLAEQIENRTTVTSPDDIARFARLKIGHDEYEKFMVVYMDTQNQIISHEIVSQGTINKTVVHPRNIVKEALLQNANSVIIIHNHPTGILEPSKQDLAITQKIKEALEIVNISLLDHLIVSKKGSISFLDLRLL